MTDRRPDPGRDEIILSASVGGQLCHDREHSSRGTPADVIVTFGRLADPGGYPHSPGVLWPGCWGRSFAMCSACWQRTRRLASAARPDLRVRDLT